YRIQKNYKEAESRLDDLLVLAPEDPRVRYNRALLFAETERYREAIQEYENILVLDPSIDGARFELALAAAQIKDWIKAARSLEQCQTKQTTPQSAYLLGYCYKQLEQIDGALEQFKRAVELKPEFYEAHFELGRIYLDRHDTKGATREFEQAIAAQAESVEARYLLGYCYELMGEYEK